MEGSGGRSKELEAHRSSQRQIEASGGRQRPPEVDGSIRTQIEAARDK
jgi:hypothetical protein